jgi:hypothetical protein
VKSALAIAALALCLGSSAGPAWAQAPRDEPSKEAGSAPDPAMAQSLFEDGRRLMTSGDHAAACAKFEESNRLDPSAGTLLNLGKCYEALGRVASAWASYERAKVVGRAKGQTRHVEAAERFAAEIEPHVPKLAITTARELPGLRVYRGETEIAPAARATPIALDPGSYEVRAEAPGHEPWKRTVQVERDAKVTVEVPALVAVAVPPPKPPAPTSPPSSEPRMELVIAGAVVGGVGLVGLAVGAGLGAATLNDADEARADDDLCPDGRCTEAGWAHIQEAETKATASTALVVTGSVLFAGGAALGVLGFVLDARPSDVAVLPWLSPGVVGVFVGGRL